MSVRYVWNRYSRSIQYYTAIGYRAASFSQNNTFSYDLTKSNNYQFTMGSSYRISSSSGTMSLSGAKTYKGGSGYTGHSFGYGYLKVYGVTGSVPSEVDPNDVQIVGGTWVGRDNWFAGNGYCIEASSWTGYYPEEYQYQDYYYVKGALLGYSSSSQNNTYPSDSYIDGTWYTYQGSDKIDAKGVVLPTEINGGASVMITVTPSSDKKYGGTVNYLYQYKFDDGSWTNLATSSATQFSLAIPRGTKKVQVRVQAKDDSGFTSTDYTTSEIVEVINGAPPSINWEFEDNPHDYGEVNAPFSFEYNVTDPDAGDTFNVTETVISEDNRSLATKKYTNSGSGSKFTFDLINEDVFQKVSNEVQSSAIIDVIDSNGLEATSHKLIFKKYVDEVTITFKSPLSLEGDITKGVIYIAGYIPENSIYYVKVTNNANDSDPVWQDVTLDVIAGRIFYFANVKRSSQAAFNFELYVKRGEAHEGGFIDTILGAFG